MSVFEVFHAGVEALVDRAKKKDAARGTIPEGTRVLHASDLGKCPVRLYYELMSYERTRSRSYNRQLFLEDGFKHEETLRGLLEAGKQGNDVILGNMQVPPLKIDGTDVEVWGEADIVCLAYEQAHIYTPGADPLPPSYPTSAKWVVEGKAVYHDTFERYKANPASIPFYYFVQLAFYVVRLEAKEGVLIIKDRERSDYYPDPRTGEVAPEMVLGNKQAHTLIDAMVVKVKNILRAPPEIPDNVLEECRFCPFYETCYSSILTGTEHDDPEPLVLVGKTDGLSKNITEAIRMARDIESSVKDLKAQKSSINADLMELTARNKLKKIVASTGTMVRVTRRGSERFTKTAKAIVEAMKEDGTLELETAPDSYYPRYGKGVEEDGA